MSLIEIAEELYEEGEYLDSLELVLEILEKEPDNLKALEMKASLCSIKDMLPDSILAYKKLLRIHGNDDDIWAQLFLLSSISSAYRRLENFDQAIRYCEKSVKLCQRFLKVDSPQKEGFLEALVGIFWILGECQCESGRYSCAIDTYKKLLSKLSEFGCLETIADALYELASAYYKLNRTTEALSKYSEALKIYEVLGDEPYAFYCKSKTHYYLGSIRFAARDFKKALSHLKRSALLMEEVHEEVKGEGDIEDNFIYKRTKKLLNTLEKNKSPWKKVQMQ